MLRLKEFDADACEAAVDEGGGKNNRRGRARQDGGEEEDEEEEEEVRNTGGGKRRGAAADDDDDDDVAATSMRRVMNFNPLHRALSSLFVGPGAADCVAFFAPAGTRVLAAVTTALVSWRAALRAHDVPEHRGGAGSRRAPAARGGGGGAAPGGAGGADGAVPAGILRAFAAAVDAWSVAPADSSGATWGGLGALGASAEAAAGAMDDLM